MLAAFLTLTLALGACGEQPTALPPPATSATNIQNPPPTATLAPTITPAPTATSDVPRAFTSPAPTPPPIFPTATAAPTVKGPNFTATAAVPDLNLTPLPANSATTGQLAFVQAGNLWLIDSNGGNRLQLTDNGDLASDSLILWTPTFDRVVYQARTGELWTVDTTGERNLVFAPGKTARLGNPANLPPLPTQTAGKTAATPNRAPVNPAVQAGKTITDLSWSPDGHFLAFTYYNGEQGPLNSGEVWVAEIISGKPALTRVAEGFSPTWGPDSRSLAFLTRPTIKQGNNLSGLNPTPIGTSLLPPTVSFTRSAGDDTGIFQAGQGTPNPADTPPAPGGTGEAAAPTPTTTELTPLPGSPTPFILRPGGNPTPNPGNQATNRATTPTPTATSNLIALPSPTPTPTYPPVYRGTYLANQVAVYSVADHRVRLLSDSDKMPDAFLDLTGALRSYVPAPFQAAWFSPDGRFVAFSDELSVIGIIPVGGGAPITWTGSPQNFAVYDLDWLPRSDGAFVRWGNPYSTDTSRLSLITFNNPAGAGTGISGDVTNPKLVKISDLPGQKVSCASLSPGGQFFSYYDGTTLVITQSDGTVYKSYSDTECPVWSPFGRGFASVQKAGDHSIILTNLDQPAPKEIISTRAIERVFWLR
jgi:hypothetical protein